MNESLAALDRMLRELEADDRYWIRADVPGAPWTEVTRAEFAEAERKAGFVSAYGYDLATAGFAAGGIVGTITSDGSEPEVPR